MKRCFLFLSMLLIVCAGCSKNNGLEEPPIMGYWDFFNYSVAFTVVDKSGNDLLNPEVSGNIVDNDITVKYKRKTYKRTIDSRANMPMPLALRSYYDESSKTRKLSFGEFSPEKSYHGESFTIDWGDGSKDVIKFDLYITWDKGQPTVHSAIFKNGAPTDSFGIKIIKNKKS